MPALAIPPHRRARRLTTVAIVLALGGAGAACDGGRGDWSERSLPSSVASSTASTITCGRDAPDGRAVQVIESGFSVVSSDDDHPEVTYGVVLENTSAAYLALLTTVVVRLTDADGNQANDVVGDRPSPPSQAVYTIFPGQQIGIGDQVLLDRGGIEEVAVEVARSVWVPIEQVPDVGVASATEIDFERSGDAGARIDFHVVPAVDPRQHRDSSESISDAQSWAIFRDDDSDVIGGGSGPPGTSWNGLTDTFPITAFVSVSRVPDGTVAASTEIYVSPFYPPYRTYPC